MSKQVVEMKVYLETSEKIKTDDIDWAEAARVGLTDAEKYILTYFSDIESQTIVYLRDLLQTTAALESNTIAFLSMWNYEEFFHGHQLAKLLEVCGASLETHRVSEVRKTAKWTEKVEAFGAKILGMIFRKEFPAVYMAWGSMQELTTLKGYEQLARTTQNPALKTLCERIARQERRHFAFYFNSARERMDASPRARKLVRFLMERFWSPVGAGVKSDDEVAQLISSLFPGDAKEKLAQDIDSRIEKLPGFEGISLMRNYIKKSGLGCVACQALSSPEAA